MHSKILINFLIYKIPMEPESVPKLKKAAWINDKYNIP